MNMYKAEKEYLYTIEHELSDKPSRETIVNLIKKGMTLGYEKSVEYNPLLKIDVVVLKKDNRKIVFGKYAQSNIFFASIQTQPKRYRYNELGQLMARENSHGLMYAGD